MKNHDGRVRKIEAIIEAGNQNSTWSRDLAESMKRYYFAKAQELGLISKDDSDIRVLTTAEWEACAIHHQRILANLPPTVRLAVAEYD